MKVIEQKDNTWNLSIEIDESYFKGEWFLDIQQGGKNGSVIKIKKQGAAELIKVLQEWVDEKGDKFKDNISIVTVMAVVDGYVMVRRPRCIPFVEYEKDFLNKFVRVET